MNKLVALLEWGSNQLNAIAASQARFEAELLLAHELQKPRSYLHTWPEAVVPSHNIDQFKQLIKRRSHGEPIAYITGRREFWSLDLEVTPDTLIPRAETETLVEHVLAQLKHIEKPHIVDLGTGSGAIALAIASERPDATLTATDSSPDALVIAKKNAARLNLRNITFKISNWCDKLALDQYHLIVSNPPYITNNDPHLTQGDVRFEPACALGSGEDGLADIRRICHEAPEYLKSGGWLFLEHGYNQAHDTRVILESAQFVNLGYARDLSDTPRISWGQKPLRY